MNTNESNPMKWKLILVCAGVLIFVGLSKISFKRVDTITTNDVKTSVNNTTFKSDAEKICDDFFNYQNSNNTEALIALFSEDFIEKNGK